MLDKYLPQIYKNSDVIRIILNAQENEIMLFNESIGNLQRQFNVITADSALNLYEADLELTPLDNLTDEVRKSKILSRIRGTSTTTADMLKNVALSFESGEIEIFEDTANYKIEIRFVSRIGRPPNILDLQKAIEDIKPAHLAVDYAFLYNLCRDVKAVTCAAVKAKTCYALLNESLEG